MCLRCSPGLFRHACGVASCHTSSMAAKPHLGLTQNSSPTTLANERRAAQNRGVQGAAPPVARRSGRNTRPAHGRNTRPAHGAKHPRRARREIPLAAASEIPNRPKRHPQMAQSLGRQPQSRCPHPSRGGGRRLSRFPLSVPHRVWGSYHRMHPVGVDVHRR